MNENKPFKPYIPADKVTPELTVTSILVGVILAVVFGAANAYLGLRVGLTVSASIPAAFFVGPDTINSYTKTKEAWCFTIPWLLCNRSSETAAYIIFGSPVLRPRKEILGFPRFDHLTQQKEGGLIRYACRLLHVVRHYDNGIILA